MCTWYCYYGTSDCELHHIINVTNDVLIIMYASHECLLITTIGNQKV